MCNISGGNKTGVGRDLCLKWCRGEKEKEIHSRHHEGGREGREGGRERSEKRAQDERGREGAEKQWSVDRVETRMPMSGRARAGLAYKEKEGLFLEFSGRRNKKQKIYKIAQRISRVSWFGF